MKTPTDVPLRAKGQNAWKSTANLIRGARILAAVTLNKHLNACKDAAEVLALFGNYDVGFSPTNLATALQRIGVLRHTFEESNLFDLLVERATKSVSDESELWAYRCLASAVWGVAKTGGSAPALFDAIALEAPKKLDTFKPHALSNIVWAFATAGAEAPLLFEAVQVKATKKLRAFDAQSLSNIVWAYAKAGVEAPALFRAVAKDAPMIIQTFIPRGLSNTAWAFAKAG
ncbi:hypothetical protein M885DRAFT_430225, partial [Pelagophyceae sp. CCMP2097]